MHINNTLHARFNMMSNSVWQVILKLLTILYIGQKNALSFTLRDVRELCSAVLTEGRAEAVVLEIMKPRSL